MKRTCFALLLSALPQMLYAQSVFGQWCDEGWGFEITAEYLADFEHSVCEFDTPQTEGPELATQMTCRVFHYTDDGEAIETRSDRAEVSARLLNANLLEVDYNDGRGPYQTGRCEE